MKVLMIGAGREVRGGVSSVVNSLYATGLDRKCELVYLPTMLDGSKLKKLWVAAVARGKFEFLVKKTDILHVHMSSDNSFYRKAMFIRRAKKAGKKIVIHMHGSTFDVFYRERCDKKQKSMVREIFAMADAVIALSENWKAFLGEEICDPSKITVIYNAVPLPEPYEKEYTAQNILFLGILGKRKGTYDLIETLPEVFDAFPGAHVYMGGDGEREQAEEKCQKLGISSKVSFLGWVRGEEKRRLLQEATIYVLPTYHEGMPMSILEAMSYGIAVVSTYVGGIPKLIEDHKEGLLITPGDKAQLKNCLIHLLSSPEMRMQYGMAAKEKLERKFNADAQVEQVISLYRRIENRKDEGAGHE